MSSETDRIAVPTNGKGPTSSHEAAPDVPDAAGTTEPPDTSLAFTPTVLADGVTHVGTIYKGRHCRTGWVAVLKVLSPEIQEDDVHAAASKARIASASRAVSAAEAFPALATWSTPTRAL